MLEIANRVTEAVACRLLTIDEAEKFTGFLKRQRWHVEEAERKPRDEENRNYWESKRQAEVEGD